MFTMDSFGSDLPANWRSICEYLNGKLTAESYRSYVDGGNPDEREIEDQIWENFCSGEYDSDPDFPGYAPISRYDGHSFSGLPTELQLAAEEFWEPGYDYDDPDFWANYGSPDPDLMYAVKLYDKLQKE